MLKKKKSPYLLFIRVFSLSSTAGAEKVRFILLLSQILGFGWYVCDRMAKQDKGIGEVFCLMRKGCNTQTHLLPNAFIHFASIKARRHQNLGRYQIL